ncbi:MAG: DUF1553 domain-containing protein [Verrucomicrobiota bacterium]|nr:DUF1553 domain-containing protein [Verrucomicrobiota bacterium]
MNWQRKIILAAVLLSLGQGLLGGESESANPDSDAFDFWSLKPVVRHALPALGQADRDWARNPIDHFIAAKLAEKNLTHSVEANRRTLIRRVYYDLIGLPPDPSEIDTFLSDSDPLAYEKLVEKLLATPGYGERWARHWLDVVHYGDTHGYDKDKLRPNAWPYRDYVIRAFNSDKPYDLFVREQVAGDALYPDTRDGIEATGFISAGPWDFIGHAEVPETKLDGRIARNIDRDDMVKNTMNTFISTTVQCARCHDHKFDAINMTDYYRMQAVYAALDRADREYHPDPVIAKQLATLKAEVDRHQSELINIETEISKKGGDKLVALDKQLESLRKQSKTSNRPEFGYHSQISAKQDVSKWAQVDLGQAQSIEQVTLIGTSDNFNNIGDGFGFPVRYKIEASSDTTFESGVTVVADKTKADEPNPGVAPLHFKSPNLNARYVRVTATKLAKRSGDYIFALAELRLLDANGDNLAKGKAITALDSIESPVRWRKSNLVDALYPGKASDPAIAKELEVLVSERGKLVQSILSGEIAAKRSAAKAGLAKNEAALKKMPKPMRVYAGTIHKGSGSFRGTGNEGGKPRAIRVLHRGDMSQPRDEVAPGTLRLGKRDAGTFELSNTHGESDRRIALARWLTKKDHPLTWRSIVNRVWQYHFGTGIVATPNDFGRMGAQPTHPELLDWLAAEFRDNGQSIKQLHRLILTSATYRQSSKSAAVNEKNDSQNRTLWRMNRRQLEAEAIRDTALLLAGKMNNQMYGPGFRDFVLEHPEHSPHYEYHKHDPEDVEIHRRSVYRFLVRSQQQPFMSTLNCADPSQLVAKRDNAITALQSLALLNNKLMVAMARHFASDVEQTHTGRTAAVSEAFFRATGRPATPEETSDLVAYAAKHGLPNACRLLFNLNEFSFVD